MSTTKATLSATTILGALAGVWGSSSADMIPPWETILIAAVLGLFLGVLIIGSVKLIKAIFG